MCSCPRCKWIKNLEFLKCAEVKIIETPFNATYIFLHLLNRAVVSPGTWRKCEYLLHSIRIGQNVGCHISG